MVRGIRKDTGELLESEHVQLFDGVGWAEVELATVAGRPKGRWNPLPEDDREQMIGDQCSLCGYEHFGSRFNFCPHCGADMRGGGEG